MHLLVTVGQWINMWIVEQRLGAITPWETLCPYAQIFVLDERWLLMWMIFVFQIAADTSQTDGRKGYEEC